MLRKCESLIVADHILNIISNDIRIKNINGYIDCYQNGREQGYQIYIGLKAVYFSLDRHLDNIVVYVGDASLQHLSDDAYNNRKTFNENAYKKAANYIVKELIKIQTNNNI